MEDYDDIESENKVVAKIVTMVKNEDENAKTYSSMINSHVITDFDQIKNALRIKLVNREWNTALLTEDIVWREYLDLAAIVYADLSVFLGNSKATVTITTSVLKTWNKSSADVFDIAISNMQKDFTLINMAEMLQMMNMPVESGCVDSSMYVLTNKSSFWGAGSLLLKQYIREFANGENLCILPSSTHECIVLKIGNSTDVSEFATMISEINETQVEISDRLSNHAYLYRADIDEITY